jgi:NitT/TauT family transport system permease protein
LRLLLLAGFLAAWQFGAGNPEREWTLIDEFYVSKPSEILEIMWEWLTDGTLVTHGWVTLQETMIGFLLGCGAGMLFGFALGVSPAANAVLRPFVMAAYSIPKIALAPLFLLWFGLGMTPKIVLVAFIVFFLVFMNTYAGVLAVDPDLIDVMKVIDAGPLQRHVRVTAPSAAAWVITGLHVSVPYAFVGAVVGEFLAANEGLGMLIQRAGSQFRPAAIYAAIAYLVIFALLLNLVVDLIERRALRWKAGPSRSSDAVTSSGL